MTPATAYLDAGFGNLAQPARFGAGKRTDVITSSSSKAVRNMPWKKSSAAISRRSVATVAPSAKHAAG